jgi:ribosomal protein L40E
MSSFSRSSRNNHNRRGNYGSNHYQNKGILGNLFNILGSGSNSRGNYNNYPLQHQPGFPSQQQPGYPQQPQNPINQNVVVCSKCNSQIPAGSKFCLECGQKVNDILHCISCGEKLPLNAKFCLNCGTRLDG